MENEKEAVGREGEDKTDDTDSRLTKAGDSCWWRRTEEKDGNSSYGGPSKYVLRVVPNT